MPTYEYTCRSCGERLEAVQSFSEPPLVTCPKCGGELRKVFGAVGIVFKGSGFYKTDSRSSASASSTPKSTEAAPSTPATTESEKKTPAPGTDTNPASTAPAPATAAPSTAAPAPGSSS